MGLVIVAQMFPGSAIIIPIYRMMRSAHLLNTYAALIFSDVAVTLPVAIWMLRNHRTAPATARTGKHRGSPTLRLPRPAHPERASSRR